MHNNPCTGKWNLSAHPSAYPHSSASFYEGDKPFYEVTNYKQLDDVNLASIE